MAANGPMALYTGWLLKKKAVQARVFPSPISKAFITDLSIDIARRYSRRTPNRYQHARLARDYLFERAMKRIRGTPVAYYDFIDDFMSRHNVAPLPPLLPNAPENPEEPTEAQKIIRSITNDASR